MLVGSDIDGCITNGKGEYTNINTLSLVQKSIKKNNLSLFLCTGRSAPYVEAMSQILNISQWCICENGAYLYHPMEDEIRYNPLITNSTTKSLDDLKNLLNSKEYAQICRSEVGKEICISLNPMKGSIEELYAKLIEVIDTSLLYINHSTTAVDITPKGVDKGSCLKYLCDIESLNINNILSIGDSSGDLPFMKLTGFKACPANASKSVKEISDYISSYSATEGILDIFSRSYLNKS